MTVVLPVIHHHSDSASLRAAEVAFAAGCPGVFLIHMGRQDDLLDAPAHAIKQRWPDRFVGVNRLTSPAAAAIRRDAALGLDGSWNDGAGIDTTAGRIGWLEDIAAALAEVRRAKPAFAFFASLAFKGQPPEPDPPAAARMAAAQGWIATTSGAGTGIAAEMSKLAGMRAALGTAPLAVASGVTPENAAAHARYVTHILVATGISHPDRDEFDPVRLARLLDALSPG